jgi:hypothetical protein
MDFVTPGTGNSEPVVRFALTNNSGHRVKVTHLGLAASVRAGRDSTQ